MRIAGVILVFAALAYLALTLVAVEGVSRFDLGSFRLDVHVLSEPMWARLTLVGIIAAVSFALIFASRRPRA